MGYSIGYCPESTVYHVGGGTLNASNPHKTYLNFRNNLVMLQKNLPFGKACFTIFVRLWFDLAALLMFLAQRKPKDAWAVSRAHQYFFKKLFYNAKKRFSTEKHKENRKGLYKNSIILDFYLRKIKKFTELNSKDFHL